MRRHWVFSVATALLSTVAAPSDTDTGKMSYDQAVAALQTLLDSAVGESDTHTPSKVSVLLVADENGNILITQRADRDLSELHFRSTSQQTWKFRASELDPKRVALRTEPLSVFVPIKKDARRIEVTRTETKSRLEGGHEPAEDWDQNDAFVTSFVSIPVGTIETGETAAALLKRIAKTSPKHQ